MKGISFANVMLFEIDDTSSFSGKVKHELRVASYKFKSTSYELKSTSYEF